MVIGTKKHLFDPRTALFLLCVSNLIAFVQDSIYVEIGWVVILIIFIGIGCGLKSGGKWLVTYAGILLVQYFVLPVSPKMIAMCFTIFANYSRRLFPCLLVGAIIIHTITLRELILALRKLHFSEKILIPIAVTIRYFPSMKEEIGYIHDAIILRDIPFSDRVEAILVPVMISATGTAEELSEAAVTRGIENPVKKTSGITLQMKTADWAGMLVSLLFAGAAWIVR